MEVWKEDGGGDSRGPLKLLAVGRAGDGGGQDAHEKYDEVAQRERAHGGRFL